MIPVAFSLTFASRALADDETDPADELAQRHDPSAHAGPVNDPNLDRGFILPTAMTQPAGSWTYNNYELLLHGVTYGITDRLQASVTALSPITSDMPLLFIASLKGRLFSVGRLHLATQGSLSFVSSSGSQSDSNAAGVSAGAFASYCLREDCSSLLTLSTTYELSAASGSSSRAQAFIYAGSVTHGVTPHLKLLAEVVSGSLWTANGDFASAPGALMNYGVRFHSQRMAADIGFLRPVSTEDVTGGLILGLPFINFSYRWL
jgi:hypothetical protein